ncbi:beta-lactamase family protein [Qipengyuania sp. 6B39]|uniref:serine hydrolase domain-containing protein n=1 Tax=Qipengyuania proteolytica TaxID=2867239 RepID=UPI001C89EDF6|nr:serine hydrolase [Qipengyuania proteolytica]MBX7496487.1 beta-lactamase family protein [Qipengyuania proteolytica]
MIRQALAATVLLAAAPLAAQSTTQDELQARYDRALAAGYKSLFLCGAMASDPSGLRRSELSVEQYELTGIYDALDPMVREMPHRIERGADGMIDYVGTDWAEDMPPRVAEYRGETGCALLPIGASLPTGEELRETRIDRVGDPTVYPLTEAVSPATTQAARLALTAKYGEDTRTTAVLVRQGDVTRGKAFAPGFDANSRQRTWSVAKSLATTLVGAAVQGGAAEVMQSAGLGLDESDPRRAITIDNLLRMASGRYSDTAGNRTDPLYMGGTTIGESALDWPLLHPPGSVYRYANNDTLAAVQAIDGYLGAHPPAMLFERLGMHDTTAETDWQGDYILSSQVWTSAADLALVGQLYLNDGIWRGERILPEGWVEYVSSPSGPQPDGPFGYGAGFWLLNKSEGVPSDTFAAMGNRGQFIIIVPSLNVVIVRRGEDPAGSRFDIAGFTRDVLESLEK